MITDTSAQRLIQRTAPTRTILPALCQPRGGEARRLLLQFLIPNSRLPVHLVIARPAASVNASNI